MRKFQITLSCIFLWISSCDTEDGRVEIIEGRHFETKDLANYLPANYRMDKTYVYFRNNNGEELKLFIRYGNPTATSSFNNSEKFTFEQHNASLYNLETNDRVIQIFGDVGFDPNRKVVKLLNCSLMPMSTLGGCFLFINLINGDVDFSHPNGYVKEKTYLDKKFNDVFVGVNIGASAYNEVAYNRHVGVVAFKDKNAEYWVFDRFDKN